MVQTNIRISQEQKETALIALKEYGTMKKAALIAGVSIVTLNQEMKRSPIFEKMVLDARKEGKRRVADEAVQNIRECAFGEKELNRIQLIANIALANAYAEGFKTQVVEQHIEGQIRVITAVPRPHYNVEVEQPKTRQIITIDGKELSNNGG